MKSTENQKKEINLKKNKETIHLIYTYRILKFLEKASHRDKSFKDLTQTLLSKHTNIVNIERAFVTLVLDILSSSLFNTDEFLHSNELNEQSTLYRILKDNDRLEEAIAIISYIQMHPEEEIDKEDIDNLASHLRYYINHPEIHNEYKEYNIELGA